MDTMAAIKVKNPNINARPKPISVITISFWKSNALGIIIFSAIATYQPGECGPIRGVMEADDVASVAPESPSSTQSPS